MATYFWPVLCYQRPGATHTHTHTEAQHTHKGTAHTHTQRHSTHKDQHNTKCYRNVVYCWAEARVKIARMTLTIKLDGNWSSFQLANCAPPLGVTDSAIAPSARMLSVLQGPKSKQRKKRGTCLSSPFGSLTLIPPLSTRQHQATPGTTRQHH